MILLSWQIHQCFVPFGLQLTLYHSSSISPKYDVTLTGTRMRRWAPGHTDDTLAWMKVTEFPLSPSCVYQLLAVRVWLQWLA